MIECHCYVAKLIVQLKSLYTTYSVTVQKCIKVEKKFSKKNQRNVSKWISTYNAPVPSFQSLFNRCDRIAYIIWMYRLANEVWSMVNVKQCNVETIYLKNVNLMRWPIEYATIQSNVDASILQWTIHWNEIDVMCEMLSDEMLIIRVHNGFVMEYHLKSRL